MDKEEDRLEIVGVEDDVIDWAVLECGLGDTDVWDRWAVMETGRDVED